MFALLLQLLFLVPIPAERAVLQLIRNLSEEVPHGTAVEIESMKEKKSGWMIDANIFCEKKCFEKCMNGGNVSGYLRSLDLRI